MATALKVPVYKSRQSCGLSSGLCLMVFETSKTTPSLFPRALEMDTMVQAFGNLQNQSNEMVSDSKLTGLSIPNLWNHIETAAEIKWQ
jgi:hypothetical protein